MSAKNIKRLGFFCVSILPNHVAVLQIMLKNKATQNTQNIKIYFLFIYFHKKGSS